MNEWVKHDVEIIYGKLKNYYYYTSATRKNFNKYREVCKMQLQYVFSRLYVHKYSQMIFSMYILIQKEKGHFIHV